MPPADLLKATLERLFDSGKTAQILRLLVTLTLILVIARTGADLSWQLATPFLNKGRAASPGQRYLVCNADEGDPGAFMDRSMLESDPFSVIEGMIIGGFATGASRGFFYVRA